MYLRHLMLIGLVISAVVMGLSGCLALPQPGAMARQSAPESAAPPGQSGPERAGTPILASVVERGNIEGYLTWSGTVTSTNRVLLAPRVSGRLARLNVGVGDAVAAGEILAELDPAEFDTAVRKNEANLAAAEAKLAQVLQG